MSDKNYKEKLEDGKFKNQEVLKIIPDIESAKDVKKDWWWEGWIDFDVGDPLMPINMYSFKVAGDQRIISAIVETANKNIVGRKLQRNTVDILKRMFRKQDIEIVDEAMNRKTSAEEGTKS